jgi:molecular chaperone GrpE (heat shock protein)
MLSTRLIGKALLSATRFSVRPSISNVSQRTMFGFGKKKGSGTDEESEVNDILKELQKLSEEELQLRLDEESEKNKKLLEQLETSLESHDVAKEKRDLASEENEQNERRVNLEYERTKVFGAKKFAKSLFPAYDKLQLAFENTKVEDNPQLQFMHAQTTSIKNEFVEILNKNRIIIVAPKNGDDFDTSSHDAVAHIPVPGMEGNKILFLEKCGFIIESNNEKFESQVLREARVGVTAQL